MKNSNYFPHDYDSSTDKKVIKLRAKYGWAGYGIYWAIIEALAREDGYIDREVIGVAIGDAMTTLITDYCIEINLLKVEKNEICSERLLEHLQIRQKYIDAGKKGASARWNKPQEGIAPPLTPPLGEAMQSKVKESKVKNKEILTKYLKQFNVLFDSNYRYGDGRNKKLQSRLKTFSIDEILTATTNMSESLFHRGDNDRGWKADPDFILRSDEQVDKFLNMKSGKTTMALKLESKFGKSI